MSLICKCSLANTAALADINCIFRHYTDINVVVAVHAMLLYIIPPDHFLSASSAAAPVFLSCFAMASPL